MSDKPANAAFLEAETQVFESCSLKPRTRELRLQKPTLAVRAVEIGAGEPALFIHGFGLCTAHWAPLMARLPSLHCIAIDMPGLCAFGKRAKVRPASSWRRAGGKYDPPGYCFSPSWLEARSSRSAGRCKRRGRSRLW